ncbi:MAG TPA: flagellar biosynthesis protein FlgJ, partial [Erythrobacter sp.]|nr:flagellar biosynthesis protein FlgJ [Erythrobacter sp.]
MPTINPVQSANVQSAIARAATRTGVDFDYLLAQAKLESGLD